jgi:hypothetical protein
MSYDTVGEIDQVSAYPNFIAASWDEQDDPRSISTSMGSVDSEC